MLKNVVFIVSNSHSFLTTRKAAFKWLKMMERKKASRKKNLSKTTATKMNKFRKRISTKVSQTKFIFPSLFQHFSFGFLFLLHPSFLEHPRSIEANSILKSSLHALSIFPEDTSLESSKVWKIYIIFYFSVLCYCFSFMRSNE